MDDILDTTSTATATDRSWHWMDREPWTAIDPGFRREWVFKQPLQYYVHQDSKTKLWFICDRDMDLFIPETESKTRAVCIRRFYRWCKRPIPDGYKLPAAKKPIMPVLRDLDFWPRGTPES